MFYHGTQYSQFGWLRIYFGVIFGYRRHHTQVHSSTSSHLAHLYTVPFLWPWEHRRQWSWVDDFAGQCLLLWLSSRKTFFYSESGVGNHSFIDGFLLELFFSLPSPPGQCSRHLQWSALFTLLCITWHSCSNPLLLRCESLLQWQQNRSKATMYKIPAIWGCPRHF
jgi:hypothetical protein